MPTGIQKRPSTGTLPSSSFKAASSSSSTSSSSRPNSSPSTSNHPPPAFGLPAIPFPAREAASSAARPAAASTMTPIRQRGESSPVLNRGIGNMSTSSSGLSYLNGNRNGNGNNPAVVEDYASIRNGLRRTSETRNAPPASSSEIPSSSSRRFVSERIESKDDRRIRKDKERVVQMNDEERGGDPSSSSHRDYRARIAPMQAETETDFSRASLGTPPIASASSSRARTASSATTATTSSKSVLTIALQRAQSAVLLDSANNVPAAISAYSQSVRLLKEVMARVEEGVKRDREKAQEQGEDRATLRPGETEADMHKRIARAERKERAKMDEARRLKVIVSGLVHYYPGLGIACTDTIALHGGHQHDTYEDRIRMLLSMNTDQVDSDHDSGPRTPTTIDSAPSDYVTAPPMISRRSQNRSVSSLGTVSTPPATFEQPVISSEHSRPSIDDEPVAPETGGIETSHRLLSTSAEGATSANPTPVFNLRRPSLAPSEGDLGCGSGPHTSRGSLSSESTVTAMSRKQTLTSTPVLAHHEDPALESISASSGLLPPTQALAAPNEHARHLSLDSDGSDDRVPVTARETTAGWPSEHERESTFTPSNYPTSSNATDPIDVDAIFKREPTPPIEHVDRPSHGFALRRTASEQPPVNTSMTYHEMRRGSSTTGSGSGSTSPTVDMSHHSTDGVKRGVRTSSLFGSGAVRKLGSAPSAQTDDIAGLADARPKPTRASTTSIGTTGTMILGGQGGPRMDRRGSGPLLVSDSTTSGTISQRRRSPQPSSFVNGLATIRHSTHTREEDEDEEALKNDRTPSYARDSADPYSALPNKESRFSTATGSPTNPSEFGSPSSSVGNYSSASLPSRLRTFSQPGRRPSLSTLQTEQLPPIPSLSTSSLNQTIRSGSSREVPTSAPASAVDHSQPPYLIRTNSISSQGSHNERDYGFRTSPSPSWGYLGSFPNSSEAPTPTSAYASNFGSMGRQNAFNTSYATSASFENPSVPPPLSGVLKTDNLGSGGPSPLRRPFHLMLQILTTIETDGGYVSPTLYIPHQIWSQAGVKLVALETKVRMLDLLLTGLESVEKAGNDWSRAADGREARSGADRFSKELAAFEGLTEGIESTLSKKLGFASTGKKMGANSFSAWSSKLSRSLDRVTNGRSLDHPATYVDGISRVFHQAQCIDRYLVSLQDGISPLSDLNEKDRAQMTLRFKRLSEFFGGMICRFVLRDIGMMVDKYVKRAGYWIHDEQR